MIVKILKVAAVATFAATAVYAYRERKSHGQFYCLPFDFRVPTVERARQRLWNPDDPRVFTPPVFGVGWSINFYQAARDMRLIEPAQPRDES